MERFLRQIKMSIQQWNAVPPFREQRDTEAHARYALRPGKGHLREWSDVHARGLAMAVFPDGSQCKIDGHTRSHIWQKGGMANVPANVSLMVDVFACDNQEDALALYDKFDNGAPIKTVADIAYGAMNAEGITDLLKTGWIRKANIKTAVSLATGLDDVRAGIRETAEALVDLDAISPRKSGFRSGVMAAALLTLAADGGKALERFWKPYNDGEFVRSRKQQNAMSALHERVEQMRSGRVVGGNTDDLICRYALHVYDRHLQGKTERAYINPHPMAEIIADMSGLPTIKEFAEAREIPYGKPSASAKEYKNFPMPLLFDDERLG